MDDHDYPPPQPDEDDPTGLGIRQFLTLGGMFVGCVVFGLFAGALLDAWLGTGPWLLIVCTGLGVALACAGFWFRVRAYLEG